MSRYAITESDSRRWVLGVLLLLVAGALFGMTEGAPLRADAATTQAATQPAGEVTIQRSAAEFYGPWVFLPPLLTILLAIFWRQVIPALFIGIVIAAYMVVVYEHAGFDLSIIWLGLIAALERFTIGALATPDHSKVIIFTLMIGAMVGVIAANGGTPAVVHAIARWASSRARGQVATWFAGLLVFFDDYANSMIVGPAMRPVCDRLRISRAKLAYLVDSTAAPVSSIALVSTWVGTEVGYIDDGMKALSEMPAALADISAYQAFLYSIPHRFYAVLALVMVLFIGLFNRDFGPMLKAEREFNPPVDEVAETNAEPPRGRIWFAALPILVLVVVTLGVIILTGYNGMIAKAVAAGNANASGMGILNALLAGVESFWDKCFALLEFLGKILSNAKSYDSILYGAFASLVVAVLMSVFGGILTLTKTVDAATDSMARMLSTLTVLVLAWGLSAGIRQLELGMVALDVLEAMQFDVRWLPLAVFLSACIVSFATGTSWGTMGILCPATVTIAAGLLGNVPADQAAPLFYGAIGGVLAGSVFGDHCSPISDTTVLSSVASSCSLELHVWTQMPYAVVTALVSILCGDVLCHYLEQPWYVGLAAGVVLLLLIVLVVGRRSAEAEGWRMAKSE